MCIYTSSTFELTMARRPPELACSILWSSVGANVSCAASVPPCSQAGEKRRGSDIRASFSRKPRACERPGLWVSGH